MNLGNEGGTGGKKGRRLAEPRDWKIGRNEGKFRTGRENNRMDRRRYLGKEGRAGKTKELPGGDKRRRDWGKRTREREPVETNEELEKKTKKKTTE